MIVNDSEAKPFIEQKDVILCRSGIQIYHKSELASFITEDNKPPVEKDWYKEYRPASVVVKAQDLFKSLPVTKEHPDVWVTPQNWKALAGGTLDKEVSVVALEGEAEGEIGLKSNITFYTDELYNYYLNNREVSVGYTCKKHFVDNPEEVGYDIILDEITEVNHLAITRAGRGGSSVAVIDSIKRILGGLKPMRTGIFAWLAGKKQKVNDSAPSSFGKEVLEAVKNSKGTTEEELAGEMKGVLDSMSILKDCEAKTKLVEVVKDCFDNKQKALDNEAELTSTLDSMYTDINSEGVNEIAKVFAKDSEPEEGKEKDSEPKEGEEKDSEEKPEEKAKDSEGEPEEGKEKDSEPKEDEEKDSEGKEEKDGCHANKDSVIIASVMDSVRAEIKAMVADAVKECLGIKDDTAKITGGVIDTATKENEISQRDYSSFLE